MNAPVRIAVMGPLARMAVLGMGSRSTVMGWAGQGALRISKFAVLSAHSAARVSARCKAGLGSLQHAATWRKPALPYQRGTLPQKGWAWGRKRTCGSAS